MKKIFSLLLVAVVAMLDNFTLTSCGDEFLEDYVLTFEVIRGTMSDAQYRQVSRSMNQTSVVSYGDDVEALEAYETLMKGQRVALKTAMNQLEKDLKVSGTGIEVTFTHKADNRLLKSEQIMASE